MDTLTIFQSLYNSVTNCTGAAQRMASVKLDNLNGDITLANSAMEALQSTIGEQFTPELRELTQLKTELLNGLNDFIIENPALAKGVMAGAAAFGVMGTAIIGVKQLASTQDLGDKGGSRDGHPGHLSVDHCGRVVRVRRGAISLPAEH